MSRPRFESWCTVPIGGIAVFLIAFIRLGTRLCLPHRPVRYRVRPAPRSRSSVTSIAPVRLDDPGVDDVQRAEVLECAGPADRVVVPVTPGGQRTRRAAR